MAIAQLEQRDAGSYTWLHGLAFIACWSSWWPWRWPMSASILHGLPSIVMEPMMWRMSSASDVFVHKAS